MLRVRDWTTRKSRDFNEEYPKLRLLFHPVFSKAFVFSADVFTHLCVCIMLNQSLCIIYFLLHRTQAVCLCHILCWIASLFLSVYFPCLAFDPPLPPLGSIPGYFPTQMSYLCWEHVSLLLPLTPSSSHTGCLMAPSTTFCMKAPVSTSILFTKSILVTTFWWFAGVWDLWHLHSFHNVAMTSCTVQSPHHPGMW